MVGGRVILDMPNPALDGDGDPYSKAKIYYYLDGTSTLTDIFSDPALTIPLANPLISDGAGRFVEVWADASVSLSARWTDTNDAMIFTFDGIDPISPSSVSADGSGVDAPAFRTALGLGSAALADTGTSGTTLGFLDGNNTYSGNQNFTNGAQIGGIDAGYLGIPPETEDTAYAFTADDRGHGVFHTSASAHAWTIPPGIFSRGDAIYVRNTGTGAVTLTRGAGVVLRIAGSGTDADVTLASYGAGTIICDNSNVFCISGAGIS